MNINFILVLIILYLHWDNFIIIPKTMNIKSKLGGCKGTRYGCCPDGITSKNKHGTNC